jgi:alkanesulfonate monooxygenase SsuD/methylene tetrahydromethanopterin reductase-like flavin-dependent oxidoreductase (luciferase family)
MPLHQSPDELAGKIRHLRELAQAGGRDDQLDVSVGCRFRFATDSGEPDTLTGTPERLVEQLRSYAAAGVAEVHLLNDGYRTIPDLVSAWERFASDVIPKV